MARRLSRKFFAHPCLEVARALIGMHLVVEGRGGRIVETEAYVGALDQACHARFGESGRARPLFGRPGVAYVYLIYGMYECFNVVTEPAGRAAAVLIRALEPAAAAARAQRPDGDTRTDGPGRLSRALGISRADNNADLCARGARLWFEDRGEPARTIVATPRIGIDYAGEWAARPWRFVDADSQWLSRRLPAPRKRA